MAQSAVLIIGGATSYLLKGRGSLQDIDQIGIMKPVCKHVVSVSRVRDIAPTLRKAIQIARSDVPGPVFVEMPVDALHPIHVVEAEMKLNRKPNSIRGYLIHWQAAKFYHCTIHSFAFQNRFMELYLSRLFSDAWKPTDVAPLPVKYKKASSFQVFMQRCLIVKSCRDLLTRSKQPLIIIGGQAMLLPDRIQDLVSALKVINVPCYCNGMARGLLADAEHIQMFHKRREALKEADLVILAGAACDFRLDYGRSLNPEAKMIAINRSNALLRQNVNVFWKASIFLQADPCDFIIQLADSLSDVAAYVQPEDWLRRLKSRDQQAEEDISKLAKTELTSPGINPIALLRNIEELIPKDAIIVMDGGDFVGTAAYVLKARGPLKWLDPGAFGTLGVGAGFALGAKLCHPDLPVWIIFGDGAFGFSVAEIDSLVRHQTPVIAIIGNDNGWAQIQRTQISLFGSSIGCVLSPAIAYEKVAEGFGAIGFAIDSSNANELNKMITSIKDQPRAAFVNALIGRTNFRDGSVSI
ncbi:thiamine pyrophosphate enzyme, TPP binding domain protein [Trichuris suis]|nr:thiamine pyrophosphate enzyme, TPP binding domain protein [Trichuris suis]